MKILFRIVVVSLLLFSAFNAKAESRKEFIKRYKHLAVKEMERTGIPASIKLAQAILESGCGDSDLSTKANNHFGIKCHDWTGPTFTMDDDSPDECFRKYKTPEQSWVDHSTFLTTRSRYAGLFSIPTTDYKGWAKGLKAAGYATNPKYADLLIKVIEDEELYKFDKLIENPGAHSINSDEFAESITSQSDSRLGGASYRNREAIINGIPYIEVREGDSFQKIAEYYGIKLDKLLRMNDAQNTPLESGQIVFLKSKKNKAAEGNEVHQVKAGESLYSISQLYGVKLDKLVKYNYISQTSRLAAGEKVYLRGYIPLY